MRKYTRSWVLGLLTICLTLGAANSAGGQINPPMSSSSSAFSAGQPNTPSNCTIGVIVPLSGPYARMGEYIHRGIELAREDLSFTDCSVVFEDSRNEAPSGVSAYQKLRTTKGLRAIYAFATPVSLALRPLVRRDDVVLVAHTTAGSYSVADDWAFRMTGSADLEGSFTAEVISTQLHKKRVAILELDNDFGAGLARIVRSTLAKDPTVEVVLDENIPLSTTDMRSVVVKVRQAKPDVTYLALWPVETAAFINQSREQKLTGDLVLSSPSHSADLFTATRERSEGVYVITPEDRCDPQLLTRYKARFGEEATFVSLRAYDTLSILAKAIRVCPNEGGACINRFISERRNEPGICFPITIDANGDLADRFILKQVIHGAFVDTRAP